MNRAEKRRQKKLERRAATRGGPLAKAGNALERHRAQAVQQSLDIAVRHHNAGELQQAEAIYRQILQADPDQPVALHLLGVIAHQAGNQDEAVDLIRRAIAAKPDFAEAHSNLGLALRSLGRLDEAIAHYHKALELKPGFADAHFNLGNVLRDAKQLDQAAESFRQALRRKADHVAAMNNLGLTLHDLGELDAAVMHFENAIRLDDTYVDPVNNLANAIKDTGRLGEATRHYQRAIALRPDMAEACFNFGITLAKLGRIREACEQFRRALEIDPDYTDARSTLLMVMNYEDFDPDEFAGELQEWRVRQEALAPPVVRKDGPTADPDKHLNIGFVSGDLRTHSVTYFLAPLFERHNPEEYSFHCYSNMGAELEDGVSARLQSAAVGWHRIGDLDDDEVVQQIARNKIDILIDLSGHTKGQRLTVFAHKPAPVQATWLGYPGSTGLSAVDYRITDAIADPTDGSGDARHEELVRLPGGFLCYGPPGDAPDPGAPPCEKNGTVTFASFNNLSKITPAVIEAWSRILKAVPNAKILMKCRSFSCPDAQDRYRTLFGENGISDDRLRLVSRSATTRDHLALYGKADIALDSFPYNGTTTTCEALWMGVPVVATRGVRHAARVSASLLTQIGLDDLIADSIDGYVDRAVALANAPERLAELRQDLRGRMEKSPLCDAGRFATEFETTLREMWRKHCENGNS